MSKKQKEAWEIAYTQIKDRILSLEFKPDDIVSENRMAQQLGISRTPVREALKKLEQEGLVVDVNRRKRVYVLTVREIEEIFDLKQIIEGNIARWAAQRGQENDFARLREIIKEMDRIVRSKPEDPSNLEGWKQEWMEEDRRYHEQLFNMAGNQRAAQIVESLNVCWHRLRLGILAIEGRIETSQEEHRKITEAILNKAPDDAQKAASTHLENLKVMLVSIMRAFHYPG